ncbi:MAG: alpha/beta hydrolase [Patescibacteria group bacterium]
MKRVYVVHGWGSSPNEPCISWIREQLEKKGYTAEALIMPNTDTPVIKEWVEKLREVVQNPDRSTYFIGHSIGGQAIMRFLAGLPGGSKIGGVVFLASWFVLKALEDEEAEKIAKPWVDTPIDFESLKQKTSHYVLILSDDDPWVPVDTTKKQFEKNVGAKVIIEHHKGHFTEEDGITEVPMVIKEVEKMAR